MNKIITAYILLITTLSVNCDAQSQSFIINLKDSVILQESSASVYLNDIADIVVKNARLKESLSLIEIIKSLPENSFHKVITRFDIIRALRMNDFDSKNFIFEGADKTIVQKPHIIITEKEIFDNALIFISNKLASDQNDYDIKFKNKIPSIIFPEGEIEFEFLIPNKLNGNIILTLNLKQNNEIVKVLKLITEIKIFGEVLVASRMIGKDEIINENCLKFIRSEINEETDVIAKEEIIGLSAVKNIKEGSIISRRNFSKKIAIKKGQIINVISKSQYLQVSASGKALDNGYIGDTIKIKNSDTGKVIIGEIENSSTVVVRVL